MDTTETARAIYDAYVAKDRDAAERLIAPDFTFTSPLDNGLDREAYFRICWPSSEATDRFEIVGLAPVGDRVWVTYTGRWTDGRGFRNTELLTIRDGRITGVEVYFGWSVPHPVPAGTHADPELARTAPATAG